MDSEPKDCLDLHEESDEMVENTEKSSSVDSESMDCEADNSDICALSSTSKKSRTECKLNYLDAKNRAKETILKGSGLSPDQLKKCNDFEHIVMSLKDKVKSKSRNVQCQILTVIASVWSAKKISQEFGVSIRLAKKAKILTEQHGILPQIPLKCNLKEADDTSLLAYKFFQDNNISCEWQGTVLVVRNGQRIGEQKRLLIFNLKEIHSQFLMTHPKNSIGFSQLCLMQPTWCTASSIPNESSFCRLHQNVKLMIQSLPRSQDLDYEELLRLMLCREPTRACYTNKCDDCPGRIALEDYIANRFYDDQMDGDDEVPFLQWLNTSEQPDSILLDVDEFTARLVERCHGLKLHHFIAKAQSQFLLESISNLDKKTAVIFLDFSENFSFIFQDRKDGFFRSADQATLHPFTIHYRNDFNNIKTLQLCVISNCLMHNFSTVYAFNHEMIDFLKSKLPHVSRIMYFSHGSLREYKNKENLKNLCYHEEDFKIKAEWHFLPVNHGKKHCNKISAKLKYFATRTSLQRPETNQILCAQALHDWATTNLYDITFIYVSDKRVQEITEVIEDRMKGVSTPKGIISCHAFVPTATSTLQCAYTSKSSEWQEKSLLALPSVTPTVYRSGNLVVCVFDSKWWLGMVTEATVDDSDYKVSFMHPNGPADFFHWPEFADECYIPADNILCSGIAPISLPNRQYELSEQEKKIISECFCIKKEAVTN